MDAFILKIRKLRQKIGEQLGRTVDTDLPPTVMASSSPEEEESLKIRHALDKLNGRDRLGVAAERMAVAGSAVAGGALAGSVAGVAGASTLLGSTGLAGLLGGVFVTATPVGWVIGSTVVAGAAGYGVAKLLLSGGKQDRVRAEFIERLNIRLAGVEQKLVDQQIDELGLLLNSSIASGLISSAVAERMVSLVEKGVLSPDLALLRLSGLALDK